MQFSFVIKFFCFLWLLNVILLCYKKIKDNICGD